MNLEEKLNSDQIFSGITATSGGFYGPQGRILRLALQDHEMNTKIESFSHKTLANHQFRNGNISNLWLVQTFRAQGCFNECHHRQQGKPHL